MFDSELFYFDIVSDVCVYNNFIETICQRVSWSFTCNRYTPPPQKNNLSNIINLCEYTFKPE